MAVDRDLVGAWTRSRLVVDGTPCADVCKVLWLQTIDLYADIRVPCRAGAAPAKGPAAVFARPWAFAGTATWDPPVMTWHHQLDSMLQPNVDSNPLERDGDLLVESGRFKWAGLWIPFREEWRRLSRSDDVVGAEVQTRRIQVTIGAWRIDVEDDRPSGNFRATWHDFKDGTWRPTGSILEPPCGSDGLANTASGSGVA